MDFEQLNLFDFMSEFNGPIRINKKIRLIELFGGVGAQAQSLQRLGVDFEHYRYVEWDKYPVASYNSIFDTDFVPLDVTKIHGWDLGIHDKDLYTYILTYSFPCQDLSCAGLGKGMKKGSGTRSGLLWEVERLLDECPVLPDILLMENVPMVHSPKNMPDFQDWLDYLQSKGYNNFWQDLNALDYGVAQSRKRCFCVSTLGNHTYKFPNPIPLTKTMKDYLEDEVDEKYYINTEKAKELIDKLIIGGKILTDKPRSEQKCIYCNNLLGKKGSLGMCNKHYIQYKRWGDPLHSDNKERATVDGYYRDSKTGRREHRIIWENHYGVSLSEDEVIHHINFVKTDNRIENLYKYPNASEHVKAHREYERLQDNLKTGYEIVFEDGHYVEREREQTDRQSTYQPRILMPSSPQTVSPHDVTVEYPTSNSTEAEFVKSIGFIEKGTGVHQSNVVLSEDGCSRCVDATGYKHPILVQECKKIE